MNEWQALRDLIDTLWNVKKVDIRNWNEDHRI